MKAQISASFAGLGQVVGGERVEQEVERPFEGDDFPPVQPQDRLAATRSPILTVRL
ncbi:hypothetical protein ACN27J_15830 [Solwaraspora sp. WMMB762]|uniref:hypothetical protein n=1 Tax=Solwaraspora sp. WMMB762 TaxID=3404120 RepID=UPI003B95D8DC